MTKELHHVREIEQAICKDALALCNPVDVVIKHKYLMT